MLNDLRTKYIILGCLLLIVVFFAAGLGYMYLRNRDEAGSKIKETKPINIAIEKATSTKKLRTLEAATSSAAAKTLNTIADKAIAAKDFTQCQAINERGRIESCLTAVALTAGKIEACEQISDPEKKTFCLNGANAMLAKIKLDENYCDLITDSMQASFCYLNLLELKKYPVDFCEKLSEKYRLNCLDRYYTEEAKTKKQPEICQKIITAETKDSCLSNFKK